jgi:hypothetical protein
MALNQKRNSKIKFRIQIIAKSIRILFLSEIQIFDPPLMEIDFSMQEGVSRSLLAKFHQNTKSQDFPVNVLVNFNS